MDSSSFNMQLCLCYNVLCHVMRPLSGNTIYMATCSSKPDDFGVYIGLCCLSCVATNYKKYCILYIMYVHRITLQQLKLVEHIHITCADNHMWVEVVSFTVNKVISSTRSRLMLPNGPKNDIRSYIAKVPFEVHLFAVCIIVAMT